MTKKNKLKLYYESTDGHMRQQQSACNQFALESIRTQELAYTKYLFSA